MSEPLDLEPIKARLADQDSMNAKMREMHGDRFVMPVPQEALDDLAALIAEVERLRAKLSEAENLVAKGWSPTWEIEHPHGEVERVWINGRVVWELDCGEDDEDDED